ncbi:MAG: adenylate kinase [Chloroflexi bacterium]|nr:adenylate kinase [Chloroflexota bacterium]
MDIVLLGAPGAGKGTQAELLREWLPIPRVSSGDLFRAALEAGTPLGLKAKSYMDRGDLVPDQITIEMVADRLARPDCKDGVIFDGFPRTVAQAQALDRLLSTMGRQIDLAVYIRVSEQTLLERLGGRWTCRAHGHVYHRLYNPEQVPGICDIDGSELYQREDDTPETQLRRIQVYLDQTAPLREHYLKKGILVEIDGEQDIMAVQGDLRAAVRQSV